MSDGVTFTRNLVKGKIAETIFAQMYRSTKRYTVLEFGYEKIIPDLVQNGYNEKNGMIETLRTAPDFAVIDKETRRVKLIEVKYMHKLDREHALKHANKMSASWNPSFLFVATLYGFYFDEISNIIENNGEMKPLSDSQISKEIQLQYLEIIKEFEKGK
jgi:hypothetical protein